MDPAIIAIFVTGVLNLVATLRQSRCTDIQSECGCCSLNLHRDVINGDDDIENAKPI